MLGTMVGRIEPLEDAGRDTIMSDALAILAALTNLLQNANTGMEANLGNFSR